MDADGGQRAAAWGQCWDHVERRPRVGLPAIWCALHREMSSLLTRVLLRPPLFVCSSDLMTRDYVNVEISHGRVSLKVITLHGGFHLPGNINYLSTPLTPSLTALAAS